VKQPAGNVHSITDVPAELVREEKHFSKKKKPRQCILDDRTVKKAQERFDIMITPKKEDKLCVNVIASPMMASEMKELHLSYEEP